MKRALASLAGLVGIAALGALARATQASRRAGRRAPGGRRPRQRRRTDPAEELRRKLADARVAEPDAEQAQEPAPAETLDERRARVHAKAREAIDAMGDDGAAS